MCLAIPGKLEKIVAEIDETFRIGSVSFEGVIKEVNLALVPEAKIGDYLLVHVLESTNATVYGEDAFDMEREQDYQFLKQHANQLTEKGYRCKVALGYGNPKTAIPDLVSKNNCDILVMGTHGHKTFKDILLGTTIEGVRHNIKVPLVLV